MIRVKPTKRTGALPTGELTRRMESYGGRKIKFPEPLYLRNRWYDLDDGHRSHS